MAHLLVPKTRYVLPNFRTLADTVALGELQPTSTSSTPAPGIDLAPLVTEWTHDPSLGVAADLIGAALVANNLTLSEVLAACDYVLARQTPASPTLVNIARQVLHGPPAGLASLTVRLSQFLETEATEHTHSRIAAIRKASVRFGDNPIVFTELARLYLSVGSKEKALRAIRIALALAPHNRFVLRSAARIYVHFDDADRAFHLLHRNPRTTNDPWLASAQLAVAGLVGRQAAVAKQTAACFNSASHSPLSKAELGSGLGSMELLNGSRRASRRYLLEALEEPNDNSLAQTEWALSVDRLFEFDITSFEVKRNYEASALDALHSEKWDDVIVHCESWLLDMPFTRWPCFLASNVASVVLGDHATGQLFCRAGLLARPGDPGLLNNLAYAQALNGQLDEAERTLQRANLSSIAEPALKVFLTATTGLVAFRQGEPMKGRSLYLEALDASRSLKERELYFVALLHYAREELLSGESLDASVLSALRRVPDYNTSPTTRFLKKTVLELAKRSVERSGSD